MTYKFWYILIITSSVTYQHIQGVSHNTTVLYEFATPVRSDKVTTRQHTSGRSPLPPRSTIISTTPRNSMLKLNISKYNKNNIYIVHTSKIPWLHTKTYPHPIYRDRLRPVSLQNTKQCLQEIINLTEGGISTHLAAIEERQTPISHTTIRPENAPLDFTPTIKLNLKLN